MDEKIWCVYLIEARNGKIYCGITNDLKNRLKKHLNGTGAKFFRSTPPKTLLYVEEQPDKSACLKKFKWKLSRLKENDRSSDFQIVEVKEFLP